MVLCILLFSGIVPVLALTPVTVQDYEKSDSCPNVWTINMPRENAAIQLSTDNPYKGKQCIKLHYHFPATGDMIGIVNPVSIKASVHKLRFMINGDNSGCTYGLYLADASGETHKYDPQSGNGGKIDFTGWKEVTINLDNGHEHWGGDNNGKIDYPIMNLTLTIGGKNSEGDLAIDNLVVDSDKSATDTLGQ
jgi:hypothetical protein